MIFHYGKDVPGWLEPVYKIGWTGVELFFVLSGYLIGHQLLKEYKTKSSIDFKLFYIKRSFRIIPAFLAVVILYFSLGDLNEGNGLPPLWRFLTFTQNFGLDTMSQRSFSHAWSLCVEEHFYLLLPITIFLVFKGGMQKLTPYFIALLIGIGFLSRLYNWNEFVQPFIESGERRLSVHALLQNVYYPSYNRMDGLAIGVFIAAIFNFKPKIREFLSRNGNLFLLLGTVLFIIAFQFCKNIIGYKAMIFGLPLISLAYGLILIGAISPSSMLFKLKSRFTFILATLSYAIYLTHKQTYHFVKLWVSDLGLERIHQWTFWICILIALIGGLILHLTIEKPFLIVREKVTKGVG